MIPANRIRFIELILIGLAVNLALTTPSYGQATPNSTYVQISGFHLVSPTEGWVWTEPVYGSKDTAHLYWTKDSGQTWTDIMPPNLSGTRVGAVDFVDNQHGSVIVTSQDPVSFHAIYSIIQTTDGGKTWKPKTLNASLTWYPADISLQFLDLQTGWLRVREQHSSNFDIGELVKTTDGGNTWTTLTLPIDFNSPVGDPVYFVTDQLGWLAGRTGGGAVEQNTLYRTQDGGQTWQTQSVGVGSSGISMRVYHLPEFINAQDGLLAVLNQGDLNSTLQVYITHDSGVTWKLDNTLTSARVVRLLDSAHWLGVVWGSGIVKRTIAQNGAPTILSQDPAVMDIVDMDFVSSSAALALASYQLCPPHATPGQCIPQNQLLYTSDGGQTWQHLMLPATTPS